MSGRSHTIHVIGHGLIVGSALLVFASYLWAVPPAATLQYSDFGSMTGKSIADFSYTPRNTSSVASLMLLAGTAFRSYVMGWRWSWLASIAGVALNMGLWLALVLPSIPFAVSLVTDPMLFVSYEFNLFIGFSISVTGVAVSYLAAFLIKLSAIGPNRRREAEMPG